MYLMRVAELEDPLSRFLGRIRFPDWVAGETSVTEPWAVQVPTGYISFYVVTAGRLRLQIGTDGAPLELAADDFVLLSHGTEHRLSVGSAAPTNSFEDVLRRPSWPPRAAVPAGATRIIHGTFPVV